MFTSPAGAANPLSAPYTAASNVHTDLQGCSAADEAVYAAYNQSYHNMFLSCAYYRSYYSMKQNASESSP